MSKFSVVMRDLAKGQQSFEAGYRDGFQATVAMIFIPAQWVKYGEKYRAGFMSGQHDYKIEKL